MVNAIGSYPSFNSTGTSAAGLEAQLTRYQRQLSDCVNCSATSKTPEGRETARALSDKIGEIKAQLEAVTTSKISTDTQNFPKSDSGTQSNTIAQAGSTTATLGNYLNVYA